MFVDVKSVISRPITAKWICALLLILILWQISTGVLSLLSLDKTADVRHDQSAMSRQKAKQDSIKKGLITAFFGDYVPNNLNDADIKQSMLDLNVVGIMFANTEGDSQVIIRVAGGDEQTFRIGDSLPGGAVIKRITEQGVLFMRNGALESLSLPKNALTFDPPAQPLENSN